MPSTSVLPHTGSYSVPSLQPQSSHTLERKSSVLSHTPGPTPALVKPRKVLLESSHTAPLSLPHAILRPLSHTGPTPSVSSTVFPPSLPFILVPLPHVSSLHFFHVSPLPTSSPSGLFLYIYSFPIVPSSHSVQQHCLSICHDLWFFLLALCLPHSTTSSPFLTLLLCSAR